MARYIRHFDELIPAADGLAADSLDDRVDLMRTHYRRGVIYGARPLACGFGLDHGAIVRRFWRSLGLVSLSADFSGAVSRISSRISVYRHANADPDHAGIVVWTRLRHGRDGGHDRLENRSDFSDFSYGDDWLFGCPRWHGDYLQTDNGPRIPAAGLRRWRNRHAHRSIDSMASAPTLAHLGIEPKKQLV